MVLEYCDEGDLGSYMGSRMLSGKKIDEEVLFNFLLELTSALKYCHNKDIIHRDLKPPNIFIKNGSIKLGDFGLAKPVREEILVNEYERIGIIAYTAPERLGGDHKSSYSKPIVVWAVGVIMYEMCTLERMFNIRKVGYQKVVDNIMNANYDKKPMEYIHPLFKYLIERTVLVDPSRRLTIDELHNTIAIATNKYHGIKSEKGMVNDLDR